MERVSLRTFAALLPVLVSAASLASAQRREAVWPLATGSHDVLHSFQNPFSFGGQYFHEGVDLRGRGDEVHAMRGGIVRYRNQNDSGGTLLIEVTTPHGVEADSYLHIRLGPWHADDVIEAGDVVGTVSEVYFPFALQDHVHVNRFADFHGGNNYVNGRTNMLHPLALFLAPGHRDPQALAAAPADANRDGAVFHVARAGSPTMHLEHATGAVELLLEATDRLSNTLSFEQGLLGVGYWIEALEGGEHVASAEQPYRLVRFDDHWRASSANCDALVAQVMVTAAGYGVDLGPDDTGWSSLATYRLTRTSGFRGLASDISPTQAWHTEARKNTGLPNGTGGLVARDIQEARFPDGLYRVHALTEDLTHRRDTPFEVIVDNFVPYVAAFRVRNLTTQRVLLDARLELVDGRLVPHVEAREPNALFVHVGDRLALELEASEPLMQLEGLAIEPDLGLLGPLLPDPASGGRTRFRSELPVTQLPPGATLVRLRLRGRDRVEMALRARPTVAEPAGTATLFFPVVRAGSP